MKIYFLLLFFCAVTKSCTPEKQPPEPTLELTGRWTWVESRFQTRGMPQPSITTPDSTGIAMEVEFLAGQKLKLYHNNTLVNSQSYELWQTPGNPAYILELGTRTIQPNLEEGPIYFTGDSILHIAGGYNDAGAGQTWRRIK
ncbi:MAG: hypothetical protein H6574_23690 [Lewinellaceae bacterium]|nr:hypothetical protein [Saprospiraceae bacterium]MCB9316307.1 hypothetical protein [Lewinellaceae bacterium]MCB9334068.1 hypothetical protein [Lewinellaceae bacterium]